MALAPANELTRVLGRVQVVRALKSLYDGEMLQPALLAFALFAVHVSAFAQTSETDQNLNPPLTRGIQLGVSTGPFMANGITGVREILPLFGVRFGFPFRKIFVEASALSGRAQGTEFHSADLGIRIDLDFEFIQYFILAGADVHYWKRAPNTFREFEYRSGSGWHTGFGFFYPISDVLSFRNDFKISFGPGTTMFVGVGFVFTFGSSEEEDKNPSQATVSASRY